MEQVADESAFATPIEHPPIKRKLRAALVAKFAELLALVFALWGEWRVVSG